MKANTSIHIMHAASLVPPSPPDSLLGLMQIVGPEAVAAADPALLEGCQALRRGEEHVALAAAASALRRSPSDPIALILSADAFNACGKRLESYELLLRARAALSDHPSMELLLAQQLLSMGRAAEAQVYLEQGLLSFTAGTPSEPSPLELWLRDRLVQALLVQGRLEDAWSQVETIGPQRPSLAGVAADLLLKLNRAKEALPLAEIHLREVGSSAAYQLLARSHFRAGDQVAYAHVLGMGAAIHSQDSELLALAIQAVFDQSDAPDSLKAGWERIQAGFEAVGNAPELHFLKARQLLLDGDFAKGWEAYESRLQLPNNQLHAQAPCPIQWQGEPLHGRTVVVVAEQGVGDVLFFSRFLPALLAEVQKVFLLVQPRFAPLLRRSYPQVVLLEQHDLACALAGDDAVWIPLASLPLRFGLTQDEIRSSGQHRPLRLHPRLNRLWQERLGSDARHSLCIGLSLTAGDASQEYQSRKRDVNPEIVFSPLKEVKASFVDLQHRGVIPSEYISADRQAMLRYPGITRDLDHLCALIGQLDVLITSDQTNAFLGGMLGVPTLAIVPPNPHFMFQRKGSRTIWYPNLVVVRAPRWADWAGASAAYATELEMMLQGI